MPEKSPPAVMPAYRVWRRIGQVGVGEQGWTSVGALVVDQDRRCFLQERASAMPGHGAAHPVWFERRQDGFLVDIGRVADDVIWQARPMIQRGEHRPVVALWDFGATFDEAEVDSSPELSALDLLEELLGLTEDYLPGLCEQDDLVRQAVGEWRRINGACADLHARHQARKLPGNDVIADA